MQKCLALLSCALLLGWGPAAASGYPDRTVRIIAGVAPGGSLDTMARLIARKLAEKWGQPVIVENRAGADGTIGESVVVHAPPDGYTLNIVNNNHTVIPSQRALAYDPVKDFAPITLVEAHPDVLVVNPSVLPVNSLKEFIALANARPDRLNFGSGGQGTPPYLEMILLANRAHIRLVNVTYQGVAPAVVALLGGEVQVMFGSLTTTMEQVKAGKLRALGVTGSERSPLMPDVPTIAEAGDLPGFNEGTWEGMLAPAGTPADIVNKLHTDIVDVLNADDTRDIMKKQGFFPVTNTPAEFARFIDDDIAKWAALLKAIDAK